MNNLGENAPLEDKWTKGAIAASISFLVLAGIATYGKDGEKQKFATVIDEDLNAVEVITDAGSDAVSNCLDAGREDISVDADAEKPDHLEVDVFPHSSDAGKAISL